MKSKSDLKITLKKIWHFIWDDNSIWSWIVNIILAFVLIKFIVYPVLSLLLGTTHPVVAVVSSSMEHNQEFSKWWEHNQEWYLNNGITNGEFLTYPMKNGFRRGDIIVLLGKQPKDIKRGDIIVFRTGGREPIIHRIVQITTDENGFIYSTKGDNNAGQIKRPLVDETKINEAQVIGTAFFRIPVLGYVKILSVEIVCNGYKFGFCPDM